MAFSLHASTWILAQALGVAFALQLMYEVVKNYLLSLKLFTYRKASCLFTCFEHVSALHNLLVVAIVFLARFVRGTKDG